MKRYRFVLAVFEDDDEFFHCPREPGVSSLGRTMGPPSYFNARLKMFDAGQAFALFLKGWIFEETDRRDFFPNQLAALQNPRDTLQMMRFVLTMAKELLGKPNREEVYKILEENVPNTGWITATSPGSISASVRLSYGQWDKLLTNEEWLWKRICCTGWQFYMLARRLRATWTKTRPLSSMPT